MPKLNIYFKIKNKKKLTSMNTLIKRRAHVFMNRTLFCYILMALCIICLIRYMTNNKILKNNSNRDLLKFASKIFKAEYEINCNLLLEANNHEIQKAKQLLKQQPYKQIDDRSFIFDLDYCDAFKTLRGYSQQQNVSLIERDFPLAFSILTYNNVDQFERLLSRIYHPQNIYCIHVDAKSSLIFKKAIESIAQCFDNVFITTKLETIVYAGISRLQADLNCMQDLIFKKYLMLRKREVSWKYLINLASTEYPLKTNLELTKILSLYNGGNDIEVSSSINPARFKFAYESKLNNNTKKIELVATNKTKEKVPHDFQLRKGSAYGSFSYEFIEWILRNKYAQDLLEWMKDIYSPDEAYWATLQSNTQFNPPGGFNGSWPHRYQPVISYTTKFMIWAWESIKCKTYYQRSLCIFSIADLPVLINRYEMFVNKLNLNEDPIVYQCIDEWLISKKKAIPLIFTDIYCQHPVVKHFNNFTNC